MSEEKVKIDIEPIGYVTAEYDEPANMPLHGKPAVIEILPEYSEALTLIEKNSHLWVLSWEFAITDVKICLFPYLHTSHLIFLEKYLKVI